MNRELEIASELKRVRDLLAKYRARGCDDTDMLYGAQQALMWVLGQGVSPSQMEVSILEVAERLVTERVSK